MSDESRIDNQRRAPEEVDRVGPSRAVRTVTGILPNGRVVWLRIDPALAPAVAVDQLAQASEQTARWRRAATDTQSDAVARLARAADADAERISGGHLERARALRRRILAGDRKIERKLAKAAEDFRARVERQQRIERESVARLGRRDLWDQITLVSALPLFAAFGQPGQPFGQNNLTLVLSLLIWLVGEEIVDFLFGTEEASPYPLRDADAWSYVAPIGNVLAGWWLLGDLQHERFVTARAVIKPDSFTVTRIPAPPELVYRFHKRLDLSPVIAPDHLPDFKTFKDVPAVATLASVPKNAAGDAAQLRTLSTKVHDGELTITLELVAVDRAPANPPPALDQVEVAVMLDTQGAASSRPPN